MSSQSELEASVQANDTAAGSVSTSGNAVVSNAVVLTAKAVEMVKKALEEEGLTGHGLRVAVQGGGCSGLQYTLDFSNEARMGDSVFEQDGLNIYVDMASVTYLTGTTIDYVSGLNGQGFKFNNPNAKRSCGCGHSFS